MADQSVAIAHKFADLIAEQFDAGTLATIRARNATPDYIACCATHDFCDANMTMSEAFEAITGREIIGDNGISDEDCALWNQAWNIAKRDRLTAKG